MSCINHDDKCKYYEDGDCGFCYMGDGYPYHAPCFVCETHGEWVPVRMNPRFLKCSVCAFMVNKNIVLDTTQKDPLVFKHCPNCGAKMKIKTE